jgi:hypothetical protein
MTTNKPPPYPKPPYPKPPENSDINAFGWKPKPNYSESNQENNPDPWAAIKEKERAHRRQSKRR